jgi:hypothetical protein
MPYCRDSGAVLLTAAVIERVSYFLQETAQRRCRA